MKREYWKYLLVPLPYLKRFKGLIVASLVLLAASSFVTLLEPWPLALLVDSVLGKRRPPELIVRFVGSNKSTMILFAVFAGLVVIFVSRGLAVILKYLSARTENGIALDFRSDLFAHCQTLTQAFYQRAMSGDFMYRICFEARDAGSATVAIPPLLQSVLTLVGMFWIAYRLDAKLALLSLTVVPFIYLAVGYYGSHIEPKLIRARHLEGLSLTMVNRAMWLLPVIVAFNRERHEYDRFRAQGESGLRARVGVTVRQTLFSLVVSLITAAGTAAVLGFGAHDVLDGRLTVGQLLVLLSYIAATYKPLETISGTMAGFQTQTIAIRMAKQILDTKPDIEDSPEAIAYERAWGHVMFRDVCFRYSDRSHTLRNVSFEARVGEVIGIVGPTGAGKTTLVRLLPRFADPQSGEVLIDGVDVRDWTLRSLREQIGIVQQEPLLFAGTIAENIRYGRFEASDEELVDAARAANAYDFVMQLPNKFETRVGERGVGLSIGERQRICVARAFLKNAPILILDEPTASVDSNTENIIIDGLERLMEGRTTFMIAHRLSTLRRATKILVIDDGEIVEQGTEAELLDQDGLYQQLWRLQVGRHQQREHATWGNGHRAFDGRQIDTSDLVSKQAQAFRDDGALTEAHILKVDTGTVVTLGPQVDLGRPVNGGPATLGIQDVTIEDLLDSESP